ncbi:hypothetical protein CVT24_010564 [Panaeolus cyanescens]|uniref:Kinesin motor domain-containing protein n=1 Tax=Panaeolus cyanescens TaxID=181874 RepID=A0A409YYV5_9AGAR|nr:hypothetical protein CVT24_010564 [Panaeolus cyanescens]
MATRRPTSSRARYNSNATIPPQTLPPRPKSVMAKPTNTQDIPGPSTKPSRGTNEDEDTRIQVIIRCRGRSEKEIQENSPGIVQIEGAKAKDLTIETAIPISSLGMVTHPPTRTYPFDLVFGAEATQSMIYHDVVGPMLKEVLTGYNCTLFAYGQTGTGKTYTMQGDVNPTPMGNPSTSAGIIPRVLFRLFHELETSHTDFVVKISFIELYNEELRDLLSSELLAPSNMAQPMGLAAKDSKAADGGLKIFDDANKRGVVIQGLEEIAVKDCKHALALLLKGSERRQIAATKFNDHSSRSHSVFSITVHLKETNNMGDDLLKVGKLNLVDLAGSENIGRSGAENKRAREAGMINQSLLTLGRVINALVDKASHVPYRESKLTRLLQDSLGGRTKTCIIATISPARSNLEETLSTLDYALRAKSIHNKPELNQRMTRNSLLKEYVAEIERLKADILAAREKNGIYFSEESWASLNAQHELRETELVEAKKQVGIIEDQMRLVRDEFDQSIALLKRKEEELQQTKDTLTKTEDALARSKTELHQVTDALEEEVVIRQAHQETETQLNDVAAGLKEVARQGLRDVHGLFQKLERKEEVLQSNRLAVSESEILIRSVTEGLLQKLFEFREASLKVANTMASETTKFKSSEQPALTRHLQLTTQHFKHSQSLIKDLVNLEENADEAYSTFENHLGDELASLKTKSTQWTEEFHRTSTDRLKQVVASGGNDMAFVEQSISTLYSLMTSLAKDIQTYLRDERKSLQDIHDSGKDSAQKEIARLKQQNKILANMIVQEQQNAEKARGDLLQSINGLLGDFLQQRDAALRLSVTSLQKSNDQARASFSSTLEQQSKLHGDIITQNEALDGKLRNEVERATENRTTGFENISKAKESLSSGVHDIQRLALKTVSTTNEHLDDWSNSLIQATESVSEERRRNKRARLQVASGLSSDATTHYESERRTLSNTIDRIDAFTSQTSTLASTQTSLIDSHATWSSTGLESIQQANSHLATQGNSEDLPTGNTPRKRKWEYADTWNLTKGRQDIVDAWRGGRATHNAPSPALTMASTDDQRSENFTPTSSTTSSLKPQSAENVAVILLSFVLALGFLLIILSCALWQNWLPLLVALTFVLAPLPNALFSHCGSDELSGYENTAAIDLGRFITAMFVVTGFALPIVLAHSSVIDPKACAMSIAGGGYDFFLSMSLTVAEGLPVGWYTQLSWLIPQHSGKRILITID